MILKLHPYSCKNSGVSTTNRPSRKLLRAVKYCNEDELHMHTNLNNLEITLVNEKGIPGR
jgi:hypothetical protein